MMSTWIFAVLCVFVIQTMIPSSLRYLRGDRRANLMLALGGRDDPPPETVLVGRASRALNNMHEALPVFLALALMAMTRGGEVEQGAVLGAQVFFACRVLYVPAYLIAIPGVRSVVWCCGAVGLGMMASWLV